MRAAQPNRGQRFRAVASLLALWGVSTCGGGTEPSLTPLDVRSAPGDTATVYGWVYHPAPRTLPWAQRRPIPGVVVELGTWRGTPYEFRDSLVHAVGAQAEDPRFHVVARTRTDATGRFRFGGLPKPQTWAMRARPPRGLGYRVTYFESLFALPHVDSANFSITFEAR